MKGQLISPRKIKEDYREEFGMPEASTKTIFKVMVINVIRKDMVLKRNQYACLPASEG